MAILDGAAPLRFGPLPVGGGELGQVGGRVAPSVRRAGPRDVN
jgi:hypothetical protein